MLLRCRWIAKEISTAVPRMSKEAADLLKRFLVYLPCVRLQAEEALRNPYFDAVRDKVRARALSEARVADAAPGGFVRL